MGLGLNGRGDEGAQYSAYGVVVDAGSSHTSFYVYALDFGGESQGTTAVVEQNNECRLVRIQSVYFERSTKIVVT